MVCICCKQQTVNRLLLLTNLRSKDYKPRHSATNVAIPEDGIAGSGGMGVQTSKIVHLELEINEAN